VRFEWDEEKNRINSEKHGLDFEDASRVFESPMLEDIDDRENYGEERWIGIGSLRGRIVVITFVYRGSETIRVISMRKALKHERIRYEQNIRDRLGTS